jgi:hypothetical protein
MNDKKLQSLFGAARRSAAPTPPADFAADVLRAVRQLPPSRPTAAPGIFDQLNAWFPRLAIAAFALIVLCLALDLGDTVSGAGAGKSASADDEDTSQPSQSFFNVEDV